MSNELTVSLRMAFESGDYSLVFALLDEQSDITGTNVHDTVQTIGTSEEALSIGDAGVGGFCIVHNLDTSNKCSVRAASGATNLIDVPPGKAVGFYIATAATAPYCIATTAPVKARVIVIPAS